MQLSMQLSILLRADLAYNLAFAPPRRPMNMYTLALLVLTPLLVWRVHGRLKAMVVRQRSIVSRHWTGLAVFTALLLVVASELQSRSASMAWLAVGAAGGIGYGIWGFRLTRLEDTEQGLYFTPNPRLGILVALLFAARLLYVGFDIYANQDSGAPMPPFLDSPLTVLMMGMLGGYYGSYSAALLRWRYRLRKAAR